MSEAEKEFRRINKIPELVAYDEMRGIDYTNFQFNTERTLINICRKLEEL